MLRPPGLCEPLPPPFSGCAWILAAMWAARLRQDGGAASARLTQLHMQRLKEIRKEAKLKKKQEEKKEAGIKAKGKKRAAVIKKTPGEDLKAEEKKKKAKETKDAEDQIPYVLGRAFSKAAAGSSRALMLPRPKSKAMIIECPGAGSSNDKKESKEEKGSEEKKKPPGGIKILRNDMPMLKQRGRGNRGRALEVASDPEAMTEAREKLRKDMIAPTTAINKDAKLDLAEKLALASGHSDIYPLTYSTVEDVAAALKAADFSSGAAYLKELRARHEDLGHKVEPWLHRLFARCQASIERGLGGQTKARTFKLALLAEARK